MTELKVVVTKNLNCFEFETVTLVFEIVFSVMIRKALGALPAEEDKVITGITVID